MRLLPAGPKPFRPFFLLAVFDAVLGSLLPVALLEGAGQSVPADWHRNLLLFAFVPAMLSGFLLTALPRWTRLPLPVLATPVLLALSLVTRACLLFFPALGIALASLCILALGLLTAAHIYASGDRRNIKIAGLLIALGGAAFSADFGSEAAVRVALGAIVGLLLVVGGRVVPELTKNYAGQAGGRVELRRSPVVERAAAITAAGALSLWSVTPESSLTAFAAFLAATVQLIRAAGWQGWRVRASSVLALHVGYFWIVAGFALLSAHVLAPDIVTRATFLHAWTIGGIGTMGLAVMASMIRRHGGRPFARNGLWTASFWAITLSAGLRLLAEFPAGGPQTWSGLSTAFWVAAFVLFLAAFRDTLLARKAPA